MRISGDSCCVSETTHALTCPMRECFDHCLNNHEDEVATVSRYASITLGPFVLFAVLGCDVFSPSSPSGESHPLVFTGTDADMGIAPVGVPQKVDVICANTSERARTLVWSGSSCGCLTPPFEKLVIEGNTSVRIPLQFTSKTPGEYQVLASVKCLETGQVQQLQLSGIAREVLKVWPTSIERTITPHLDEGFISEIKIQNNFPPRNGDWDIDDIQVSTDRITIKAVESLSSDIGAKILSLHYKPTPNQTGSFFENLRLVVDGSNYEIPVRVNINGLYACDPARQHVGFVRQDVSNNLRINLITESEQLRVRDVRFGGTDFDVRSWRLDDFELLVEYEIPASAPKGAFAGKLCIEAICETADKLAYSEVPITGVVL